jgi:hypothetical protein
VERYAELNGILQVSFETFVRAESLQNPQTQLLVSIMG